MVLSLRSSICRVFQKELCPSLLSHPSFIADKNVEILWSLSLLFDFEANNISWDIILAFSLIMSSVSVSFLSPQRQSLLFLTFYSTL